MKTAIFMSDGFVLGSGMCTNRRSSSSLLSSGKSSISPDDNLSGEAVVINEMTKVN